MGAPKLKIFPKSKKVEQVEIKNEKREIELLKQVINEKIKNPEMAKRAARILENIIKE